MSNRTSLLKTLLPCLVGLLGCTTQGVAAQQQTLPTNAPWPGGVALVTIGPASAPAVAGAWFEDHRVLLTDSKGQRIAVIGIPLTRKPGPARLRVDDAHGQSREITFRIQPHDYPAQHITLKDSRKVTPPPATLARIAREQRRMLSVYAGFHTPSPRQVSLTPPAHGPLSSEFGLRRFFNGQPRRPHSGIDIAATEGSPVRAPLAGRVALTGNLFFNGNTVMLDHGGGLVTLFCHLADIAVAEGDNLEVGDLLGHVGQTGRATGPHLHWSVSLNGARIDPLLLANRAAITTVSAKGATKAAEADSGHPRPAGPSAAVIP